VADGVGGQEGGEIASQIAVDGVANMLGRAAGPADISDVDLPTLLHSAVLDINRQVFDAAVERQGGAAMATTLSIAVITGDTLWMGHVGDSRIYLYRNHTLEQLTSDHSWVAEEVARGAMTAAEAATDRRRNLLTRAVGTAADVDPATLKSELFPGDTLLLCSDGLYGMVAADRIAAVLGAKQPEEAADILVNMANTAGGTDNITAIVARVLTTDPLPATAWDGEPSSATIISSAGEASSSAGGASGMIRVARWIGRVFRGGGS
jgi:protein phosphatase